MQQHLFLQSLPKKLDLAAIPKGSELPFYVHGSMNKIETGDCILPGAKIGKDNYGMGRNHVVFVTRSPHEASSYGKMRGYGSDFDQEPLPWAKWLYAVVPERLYRREVAYSEHIVHSGTADGTPPCSYLLTYERVCERALVVARYRCTTRVVTTEDAWGKRIVWEKTRPEASYSLDAVVTPVGLGREWRDQWESSDCVPTVR